MTILDLIDETLRKTGSPEEIIADARQWSVALYSGSDDKARLNRDLTEDEIQHYRTLIMLVFAAVLVSPEYRQEIQEQIEKKIKKN